MKNSPILQKLRRLLKRGSSILLLFQRSPAAQILLPEVNMLTSAAAIDATKLVIATVVGLGAYDSVAGATSVGQVTPSVGSSIVPVTSGVNLASAFQVIGAAGRTPESWSISSGSLPSGLTLSNPVSRQASVTGTTTQAGDRAVTITAWEFSDFSGRAASGTFTFRVTGTAIPATITTHPASTLINPNGTATLTVIAAGTNPLTYAWFQGTSGTTTTSVGTNSASFTTPALNATTNYWVRVTNAGNATGANSNTATVTVRQPAAITTHPASTTINSGQTTTLSVVASGDTPLTYQWFRGPSGSTTNPVGSNSASFTTPALAASTDFWVRVTNLANVSGANSDAATVTVRQPAAITTAPVATSVNFGDSTTLSVVASGDGPLTYQWYEGASGVITTPVGTDSASFTTPTLTATTSYWVKVSNEANPTGANSAAAVVTVLLVTPSYAHAMSLSAGLFAITERGTGTSTFFGWDTFNDVLDRAVPISDSTPDIGTTTVGANFQTTNAEDHVIDNGDLSFTSGTLAEEITVPTIGTIGTEGFTTIVMQIAANPGAGPFPATITLNSLNGLAPTVVQAVNSVGDGQLWAKWNLPGNQASYTITIAGPANQANFGFDKVTVDTHFSTTAFLPDSVAATPPSITTSLLAPRLIGGNFLQQLAAQGGTAPYRFVVSAGALPLGLALSSGGAISGTPTSAGTSQFTVQLSDANILTATKVFTLATGTAPVISTASSLAPGSVGSSFSAALAVSAGTAPYTWSLSSGTLPAGITLSEAGVLSGIPTDVATSNFTLRVQDAIGLSDTKAFSLRMSNLSIVTATLLNSVRNVVFNQSLVGQGGTAPYSWALSSGSLPPGLSLSSAGVLSGTPSLTANASTFTVRLTDSTGFAVTRQLTLPVSAVFLAPVLQPVLFPTVTIGADFSFTVTALNYPKTFVITGLPLGLKFVPTTGVISGRPLVSGLYNVQVRAVNTGGTSAAVTTRLIVRALDKNLIGTFGGVVTRNQNNGGLGGSITVTTTSLGSFTVNLVGAFANSTTTRAATKYSVTGNLTSAVQQVSVSIGGQALSLMLNASTGQMTGTLGAAAVNGWRSAWNALSNPAESLFGYYSMAMDLKDEADTLQQAIPQGTGFATFSVSLAGTLTTAGRTADGETITSASFLSSNGDYWAYAPLYKNAGSIQGALKLTEDAAGLFAGNAISGVDLTWFKPTIAGSRAYPTTFGPINLKADGGYLAPSSKGSIVLGLPDPGNVSMSFTDGGLASSATDPDMSFIFADNNTFNLKTAVNPGKVAMTLNVATGAVSGSFDLIEASPPLVRPKVAFLGQVVRSSSGSRKAVGYFLLPQIPTSLQTPTTSPILSGGFNLQ
ncbi:MAG: putative Ig domain-containing protein [Verrucomicrobia bacterium]|nr:putative Ig domain-containing protein [Verrucomicrobiota bacterium]